MDGGIEAHPPLPGGLEAVLCSTGHAVIATRLTTEALLEEGADGFGGACSPGVLLRMADGGWVDSLDATLVARATGGGGLPALDHLEGHPRMRHARALRSEVGVFGDAAGFVTIGKGLGGVTEMSVEVDVGHRDQGHGRRLIRAALGLRPAGEPVFANVAPGNAASLRAFLASGFRPVGSVVVIRPSSAAPGRSSPPPRPTKGRPARP